MLGRIVGTHKAVSQIAGSGRVIQCVIVRGHALVQNVRRGHYELGIDARGR